MQTESRTSSLIECYAEVQPILCKDIHYLRNKYDSNHNNSKCACAQFNILALASGKADYLTQNSKFIIGNSCSITIQKCSIPNRRRSREQFLTQNSKLLIPYTSSSANFTLKPRTVANIISISFQNE